MKSCEDSDSLLLLRLFVFFFLCFIVLILLSLFADLRLNLLLLRFKSGRYQSYFSGVAAWSLNFMKVACLSIFPLMIRFLLDFLLGLLLRTLTIELMYLCIFTFLALFFLTNDFDFCMTKDRFSNQIPLFLHFVVSSFCRVIISVRLDLSLSHILQVHMLSLKSVQVGIVNSVLVSSWLFRLRLWPPSVVKGFAHLAADYFTLLFPPLWKTAVFDVEWAFLIRQHCLVLWVYFCFYLIIANVHKCIWSLFKL